MFNWIDGVPSEPGVYWAELCDQGGWPFITVLIARTYYPKGYDFEAGQKAYDAACAEGMSGITAWSDKHQEVLELQYMIPHSSGITQEWQPITSLWNCSKHIKIEQPPDTRPPPFWYLPSLNTRLSDVEGRLAAMEVTTKPAACGAMFDGGYTCERDAGHKEPQCALRDWLPLGPKPTGEP